MNARLGNRGMPAFLLLVAVAPAVGRAQTRIITRQPAQIPLEHVITVSRSGTALATPDLGILIMAIHSSAPTASNAASANAQKVSAVKSALASLGFSPDRYKFSDVALNTFGSLYIGNDQPPLSGAEASQFVYVYFEGPELNDLVQLTGAAASAIEALRKAGAVPANIPQDGFRPPAQMTTVIFTLKNSDDWENQALQQALARTHSAAQAIAKQMGVRITGVRSINASYLFGRYMPNSNLPELKGLPYSFFSTRSDEIKIRANATVYYNFK